jgi:hypothetical protein
MKGGDVIPVNKLDHCTMSSGRSPPFSFRKDHIADGVGCALEKQQNFEK